MRYTFKSIDCIIDCKNNWNTFLITHGNCWNWTFECVTRFINFLLRKYFSSFLIDKFLNSILFFSKVLDNIYLVYNFAFLFLLILFRITLQTEKIILERSIEKWKLFYCIVNICYFRSLLFQKNVTCRLTNLNLRLY